jgi:hypothetical protein
VTVEVLHHQEATAVGVADLEHRDHVGVSEATHALGLTPQLRRIVAVQELHRDRARDHRIEGPHDGASGAGAERLVEDVPTEPGLDRRAAARRDRHRGERRRRRRRHLGPRVVAGGLVARRWRERVEVRRRLGQRRHDRRQGRVEGRRVDEAPRRVEGQRGREHRLEDRQRRGQRRRRRRGDQRRHRIGEPTQPGDRLVQHDAEGVDVDPAVDVLAAGLLGRHVAGRAESRAAGGQPDAIGQLGDAEVEDLDPASGGEQEIGRLEVAMDHPGRVHRRHRRERVPHQRHRARWCQRPTREHRRQRLAVDPLHDHVRAAIGDDAGGEGRDDAVVTDPIGGARLVDEALGGRRIEVGGQDLDRDLGADRRLHAQVDHPHAALAEAVDEAIAGELGAEQRIGSARRGRRHRLRGRSNP